MNIPKISTFNFSEQIGSNFQRTNNMYQNYGLRLSSPISCDTVSFGSKKTALKGIEKAAKQVCERTNKTVNAEDKKHGATYALAKEVHDYATLRHKKVVRFFENIFKDLVATEKEPNNPILKIGDRVKSADSIHGKSRARHWSDFDTIVDKMEDINGLKIVLNKGVTKAETDSILDRLISYINSGALELLEVENKRPWAVHGLPENKAGKYDYASVNKLRKLIDIQSGLWNSKKNSAKYADALARLNKCKEETLTKDMKEGNNYSAVHFIFRLPGKNPTKFELQVIGSEVDKVKHVDDVVWKYLDGKNAPAKYNPIRPMIEEMTQEENISARKEFDRYRADLFLSQREKELSLADVDKNVRKRVDTEHFTTVKDYNLTPEYDFNQIKKDIEKCDYRAAISKKNLAEANKAKKMQNKNQKSEILVFDFIRRMEDAQDLRRAKSSQKA